MATSETKSATRSEKSTTIGVVSRVSSAKTVRVVINTLVQHRLYGKFLRRQTRLLAHDEKQEAKVGDSVELAQCRPISKNKAWRVVRVVKRAESA